MRAAILMGTLLLVFVGVLWRMSVTSIGPDGRPALAWLQGQSGSVPIHCEQPPPDVSVDISQIAGQSAFTEFALPWAHCASQQLGWPVSMVLAQWGVEHGWRMPDFDGFNWGNSKRTPTCVTTPDSRDFCHAQTASEGLAIYVHVGNLHYYEGVAPAAKSGGPDAAALAMGDSPWDEDHYSKGCGTNGCLLLNAMKAFNLYQYDTKT